MNNKRIVGLLVLISMLLFTGCVRENSAVATGVVTPVEAGGQRLRIIGTATEDSARKRYTVANTERCVTVRYFDNVSVEIDGQPVLLQEAVEQGKLLPEEIAAYARLDAAEGYCKVKAESGKGVTKFLYTYSGQFTLLVINDILESPDGGQHLIEEVCIYSPHVPNVGEGIAFYDENGQPLAKEEWGIAFELEDVHSTGATMVATQSGGGHQVGVLLLESFTIYCVDTGEYVHKKDDTIGNTIDGQVSVERSTTERAALDWSETLGELPAGKYIMEVTVLDYFDRNNVHPLIVKYQYSQSHRIEFTVP